jgi:hypothetical protein
MGSISLVTSTEYEPQAFDAVLVRDPVAVCIRSDDDLRLVPLDKVNHVDADPALLLTGAEIPDSFYGGAPFGFVDREKFPDIESHLADLEAETQ